MFGLLTVTTDPWVSQEVATLFGAYGGAGVGVLGAVIGTLGGLLAPRGQARGLVLGLLLGQGLLGVVLLVAGVVALIAGQPYAVWYAPLLIGGLCAGLGFGLRPVMAKRYHEAENRKIEAETLRRG